MTIREAKFEFEVTFNKKIIDVWRKHDKPLLREAWNEFTDGLCKNRLITERQYETWLNPFLK